MKILFISPRMMGSLVERIRALLERALDHSLKETSVDDMMSMIVTGHAQLWGVFDEDEELVASATTQVVQYGQYKAVRVVTLAGERMNEWMDLLDSTLNTFAKEQGAARMEAVGRHGFERKLRAINYKPTYLVLTKELV